MKKMLAIILSLVMLFATVPMSFSSGEDFTLKIGGGNTCGIVGEDGKLKVNVLLEGSSSEKKVGSLDFKLTYNKDQLTLESCKANLFEMPMVNNTVAGTITAAMISTAGVVFNGTPVMELTFTIASGLANETKLALDLTNLSATYLEPGNYSGKNATVGKDVKDYTYTVHTEDEPIHQNEVDATCTTPGGYDELIKCKYCGKEMSSQHVNVDALGHKPKEAVKENEVKETCTTAGGYDMVVYCERCSIELSKEHTDVPATGHDWMDATYTWADDNSTCTAERICNNDNTHKETETVTPAKESTDATCTTAGTVKYTATFENEAFETQTKTVNGTPLGHTEGEPVKENNVDPTCTEKGGYDEVVYCTVCEAEISRTHKDVDPLGHKPGEAVKENNQDPTCTEKGGYDEVVYCTVCEAEISRTHKDVDAAGHTNGDPVNENIVPATCEAAGSHDEVVYCSVCEAEISRTHKDDDPIGHDWTGEPTYVWADDKSECTATLLCKNDPEHKQTETVSSTNEITKPDPEKPCMQVYTAEFTNELFETQTTGVVLATRWMPYDGEIYRLGEDGKALTGWQKLEAASGKMEWFHFAEDGTLDTGWFTDTDGLKYYLEPADGDAVPGVTGVMWHDKWMNEDGAWHFFNPGGSLCCKVWKKCGDFWYYFLENGNMAVGWQEVNGKWYYLRETEDPVGGMYTGWREIDGSWYYFGDSGCRRSGWQEIGEDWYWFTADGKMVTGEQEIKGKTYYFDEDGKWIKDGKPEEE